MPNGRRRSYAETVAIRRFSKDILQNALKIIFYNFPQKYITYYMGSFFSFIFFVFSIIFCEFLETKMAIHRGGGVEMHYSVAHLGLVRHRIRSTILWRTKPRCATE